MSRLTLRNKNGELYVSIENKNPPYHLVTDEVIEKLAYYEDLEESGQLIDTKQAVDEGYLYDWYISSVLDSDTPIWTEEHLEELFNDFILIPKTVLNECEK